jgi:hypothetical protein
MTPCCHNRGSDGLIGPDSNCSPNAARVKASGAKPYVASLMRRTTSPMSGNLPMDFFENTRFPPYSTSKTPPLEPMSSGLIPSTSCSSFARLAALGL